MRAALAYSAVEARGDDLAARYCLDPLDAYMAATCELTDWQVEWAIEQCRTGATWEHAVYLASQQEQQRQTVELPSTRIMRRFRLWQTMELLSQSLSHYCLIRYVGRKGEEAPVIGVVLIHPAKGLGLVRYDLSRTGLLPRSKSWRTMKEYLDLLQTACDLGEGPTTLRDLERERAALAAIKPRWQRLVSFSPLSTMLGDPETLIKQLFEECVAMSNGKAILEEAPRVSFGHAGKPTICSFVRELAPVMKAEHLIVAAELVAEQLDEDAFSVKTTLLECMIRLLQYSNHHISPEQVERFMAAQERIVHL